MQNFIFRAKTKMYFGKDQMTHLPEIMKEYGKKILLVYGGGSIKRNGIYDQVIEALNGFEIFELSGVEPNPKITSVRAGVALCKEHGIDAVLAVGGGSVIDCSKVIAAAAFYEGDAWEIVADGSKITGALPIVTVLTLAATGSEMNENAVISDMEANIKIAVNAECLIPRASILDPTTMYTLPAIQTAAGTADIISHVLESYFMKEKGTYLQDRFCESILKTCIKYCPIALKETDCYEARANLMWASSMALNGLCGCGKGDAWSCHPIEHELSAFYDITHGVGLAIVTPRWMRYVLNESTVDRFVDYAVNVWDLPEEEDKFALANKAIERTEQFFHEIGLPNNLTELGIDDAKLDQMAEDAVLYGGLEDAYVPLGHKDVKQILRDCL